MSKRDYYQVLDVPRTATEAEIKKSYRRLAMKFHPDRNPDDHEAEGRFKEVKEAYEVLTDAPKRAAYDQFGHAGVDAASRGGAGGGFDPRDAFGDIFGDVFGDIFGGGRRGRSQVFRGADLRYDLELDLEQAVFGHESEVEFTTLGECEPCKGSGAEPNSKTVPCETCLGQGRIRKKKNLAGKVPAGVDNGDRIRLAGEGEAGRNGGPPGDLYVEIHVRPHEIFEREAENLSCEVPVSFATATL